MGYLPLFAACRGAGWGQEEGRLRARSRWISAMASGVSGPSAWSWEYSFLGHSACTPRVVKSPPIRGQSASTKHSTPRTGSSVIEECADDLDLLQDPVDEPGAVAGADEHSFDPGPEQAAVDLQVRPARYFLASTT